MEVLLLHGWAVSARSHWLPYLRRELKKKGLKVRAPNLPLPKLPILDEWSYEMTKQILDMRRPRIVVGHSLGGLTILRTLEEIKLPIDLAIFVSTPVHFHAKRKFLKKFFRKKYRWSKIRASVKRAVVLHAKDDPLVPAINAREIAKNLGARLILLPRGGHFMIKRFPYLKDLILHEIKHI